MLNARYQTTPIPRFMTWWSAELKPLIPAGVKRLFAVPREELLLTADENNWYLWQANEAGYRLLDTLERDAEPEQAKARVLACKDQFKEGITAAVFCMSADTVLHKVIRMPAAAEANLKQAVAFEIDRQTPFSEQDVYFDVAVVGRELPFITVDLILAQRQQVDQWMEQMDNLGIRLHGVDINAAEAAAAMQPQPRGINLLQPQQRMRKANKRVRLNWALAGLALLLLGLVMFESLYLRNETIAQLQAQRDAMRTEALQVNRLRQELDDALAAANFLAEKRASTPLTLKVLAEVTGRIPDDTWVQRMQVNGIELQLQGLSDGAQRLVEVLNDSAALTDTYFKGAISSDQRLNKERFTAASTIDPAAEYVPLPVSDTTPVDGEATDTDSVSEDAAQAAAREAAAREAAEMELAAMEAAAIEAAAREAAALAKETDNADSSDQDGEE